MTAITNISQAKGFDAALYANLVKEARSEYVSQAQIDKQLMTMLNQGKDFSEAVKGVQNKLPSLPPPLGEGTLFTKDGATLPSFGANYMAIISDYAAEDRRLSAEQRAKQTEIIIDQIKDQANKMRTKAVAQLVVGIVTGTVSIAQGVTSLGMMSKGIVDAKKNSTTDASNPKSSSSSSPSTSKTNNDMMLNTKVQTLNNTFSGVSGIMQSINQSIGSFVDADIKVIEAAIEAARAQTDALKSLEDSLKELISKALATQDAIQQNCNQTRTKILG